MFCLRFTWIWYLYPVSGWFTPIVTGTSFAKWTKLRKGMFCFKIHTDLILYPVWGGSLLLYIIHKEIKVRRVCFVLRFIPIWFYTLYGEFTPTVASISFTKKWNWESSFCLRFTQILYLYPVSGGVHSHLYWYIIHKETKGKKSMFCLRSTHRFGITLHQGGFTPFLHSFH